MITYFVNIPYIAIIAQMYLVSYLIYVVVRNFDGIESKLLDRPLKWIQNNLDKNNVTILDLKQFVILSIVTTFFFEIIVAFIGKESILNFFPFFNVIADTIIESRQIEFLDINTSRWGLHFVTSFPPGALIIFILRQLRNKEQVKQSEKHPGSKTLLSIFVIAPIILIFSVVSLGYDISQIDGVTIEKLEESFAQKITFQETPPFVISNDPAFGVMIQVLQFFISSTTLFGMIYIGTLWAFDRYLFSTLWDPK